MDSNTTNNGDNQMNTDTNDIPESFKTFLATGSSIIETCRELLAENERLRKINDDVQQVFKDHGIMSADNLRLYLEDYASVQKAMEKHDLNDAADLDAALDLSADGNPADYQTLKDFKGEIDAIHEEFDIPPDVESLRKVLQTAKDIRDIIQENTDEIDFSSADWKKDLSDLFDDYKTYKEACDNHTLDPDELDSRLEDADNYESVCDDHGIASSGDLEDALTEWEDNAKYKKGFNELSEFVDKVKDAVDDIPSTDVEDYD